MNYATFSIVPERITRDELSLYKLTQMTNNHLTMNTFSESELLVRYRNGDQDAFCEVVNLYSNSLYTFIRRLVKNTEIVEYVFQETFLHLYTSQDSFDTDCPLKPRLYTIAANKVKNALKKIQLNAS